MDGIAGYGIRWNKTDTEKQVLYIHLHVEMKERKKDLKIENGLLETVKGWKAWQGHKNKSIEPTDKYRDMKYLNILILNLKTRYISSNSYNVIIFCQNV